jgi:plasmid stabilization system protein ParE
MTPRFPYKIFYRVMSKHVDIIRILHSKQDHKRQF